MIARLAPALVLLVACSTPPPPIDAPDGPPRDAAVCPGERIFGPYDPAQPLYGEPCPIGAGCRPDPEIPGGFAGVCVDELGAGVCRPICGYYEGPPGVYVEQCCLRGGMRNPASGICVCSPRP